MVDARSSTIDVTNDTWTPADGRAWARKRKQLFHPKPKPIICPKKKAQETEEEKNKKELEAKEIIKQYKLSNHWLDMIRAESDSLTFGKLKLTRIVKLICQVSDTTELQIIGPRRVKSIVRPRQLIMYLARKYTHLSYPEIGRLLGGKDHTTVIHAERKIQELIDSEDELVTSLLCQFHILR